MHHAIIKGTPRCIFPNRYVMKLLEILAEIPLTYNRRPRFHSQPDLTSNPTIGVPYRKLG